jgi:hypothetical protein
MTFVSRSIRNREGHDRESQSDDASGRQEGQADRRKEDRVDDRSPGWVCAVEEQGEEQCRDPDPGEVQHHQRQTEQRDLRAVATHGAQRGTQRHLFARGEAAAGVVEADRDERCHEEEAGRHRQQKIDCLEEEQDAGQREAGARDDGAIGEADLRRGDEVVPALGQPDPGAVDLDLSYARGRDVEDRLRRLHAGSPRSRCCDSPIVSATSAVAVMRHPVAATNAHRHKVSHGQKPRDPAYCAPTRWSPGRGVAGRNPRRGFA